MCAGRAALLASPVLSPGPAPASIYLLAIPSRSPGLAPTDWQRQVSVSVLCSATGWKGGGGSCNVEVGREAWGVVVGMGTGSVHDD